MPDLTNIDPKRSAVLSMDLQNSIVRTYCGDDAESFLAPAVGVLRHAREQPFTVIHIHVAFRPGFPEISLRNALFGAIKTSPERQGMFTGDGTDMHHLVAPLDDEVVITKRRVSAFAGTDLEVVLRANEIDTLFLFGIATSGVVLSTLTAAADLDYRIFVIGDCCRDQDEDLHRALTELYFPKRGTVITSADFRGI